MAAQLELERPEEAVPAEVAVVGLVHPMAAIDYQYRSLVAPEREGGVADAAAGAQRTQAAAMVQRDSEQGNLDSGVAAEEVD